MSESTGSRSKMICSEMFVLCSGLLVSLAFGVSCQRSRPSEIRWLNVKQPTSTRLRLDQDRTRSQVKLIMSESFVFCSSRSVSLASGIGHERVELSSIRSRSSTLVQDSSTSSTQAPARTGSQSWRAQPNRDQAHMHEMCRVLWLISASAQLGDISKRPASLVLAPPGELASRCQLREFPAKTLDARPSRPVVEC